MKNLWGKNLWVKSIWAKSQWVKNMVKIYIYTGEKPVGKNFAVKKWWKNVGEKYIDEKPEVEEYVG